MIQTDLPRWIFASASKHFDTIATSSFPMFVEGQHRHTREEDEFFEFRFDGPILTELSKNYWRIYFEINILIQTAMDDSDMHKIHRRVGTVAANFTLISIYKYGNQVGDDGSLFACIPLVQDDRNRQRLQILHFGQVSPDAKLVHACVEGHYQVDKEIT